MYMQTLILAKFISLVGNIFHIQAAYYMRIVSQSSNIACDQIVTLKVKTKNSSTCSSSSII